MIDIISQLGGLAWTIVAFVVALSIIVGVHEYGHYIVGRWSGIRAEVFSLGFGPRLWSRRDRRGSPWSPWGSCSQQEWGPAGSTSASTGRRTWSARGSSLRHG